jgi:hypothetical protein
MAPSRNMMGDRQPGLRRHPADCSASCGRRDVSGRRPADSQPTGTVFQPSVDQHCG